LLTTQKTIGSKNFVLEKHKIVFIYCPI